MGISTVLLSIIGKDRVVSVPAVNLGIVVIMNNPPTNITIGVYISTTTDRLLILL